MISRTPSDPTSRSAACNVRRGCVRAQLMPQLMAASDPRWFMQLPGSLPVVYLCLGFEFIGITHFAWLCAQPHSQLSDYVAIN
jgi:hypothetical protein